MIPPLDRPPGLLVVVNRFVTAGLIVLSVDSAASLTFIIRETDGLSLVAFKLPYTPMQPYCCTLHTLTFSCCVLLLVHTAILTSSLLE